MRRSTTEAAVSESIREEDVPEIARIIAWSFCMPEADVGPWLRGAGLENVLAWRRDGRIEACLVTVPMGQFFGGRSVPMVGIAGVASPPDRRGTGAVVALLESTLRALRARGVALSTLYPASAGLYRRVGYENAGAHFEAKIVPHAITLRDRTADVRLVTMADQASLEECYRRRAARTNGHLDRGPYVWGRVANPRGADAVRGLIVDVAGHVDGYAYLFEKRLPGGTYSLHASDFVATTSTGYRRLLTLVADHGTLAESFHWHAAPSDPSIRLLPRVGIDAKMPLAWMTRIVDLPTAIRTRGFPLHVGPIEVELDVTDDVLSDNAGRWTLHVSEGRGQIARGGRGATRIDVRALAALYTSWLSPHDLAASGGLEGPDEDLTKLATAFSGPSPWMPDFF
jgi:predicted acetyltransferase